MSELKSVIEKLETSTTGSKELDNMIAKIVGWRRVEPSMINRKHGAWIAPEDVRFVYSGDKLMTDRLGGQILNRHTPNFTTSIDEALTLLPQGFGWRKGVNGEVEIFAPLGKGFLDSWCVVAYSEGSSTPIAICLGILYSILENEE